MSIRRGTKQIPRLSLNSRNWRNLAARHLISGRILNAPLEIPI